MNFSELRPDALDDGLIEEIIFGGISCENPPHCDAALVLGTDRPEADRVPESVACYKSGLCGKIVYSGGVVHDTEYGPLCEAEYMKRCALKQGVPESDIILDALSRTTAENMLCSALAMGRSFGYLSQVKTLLLITSAYHMKRSLLLAEALLPRHMRVFPRPARLEHWRGLWRSDDGARRRVTAELRYIQAMCANGLVPDFSLPGK